MMTKTYKAFIMVIVSFLLFSTGMLEVAFAMDGMEERGNKVMGFDQMKTTHHFRLFPDGGAIDVEANSPDDMTSKNQIRHHLSHVAKMFGDGDFRDPMLIHEQIPPGVPIMQKLKAEINYQFEETEKGGLVRISTKNPEAMAAIHEFLRFQIREHQTGDPIEVINE